MQRGFSLLLFLPLQLHWFFPHLVPAVATATALAAGSLGNPPWDGGEQDTYQEGEGFWSQHLTVKGTKKRGWGSPNQAAKIALAIPVHP